MPAFDIKMSRCVSLSLTNLLTSKMPSSEFRSQGKLDKLGLDWTGFEVGAYPIAEPPDSLPSSFKDISTPEMGSDERPQM